MSAVGKAMPIHLKETPSKSHLEGCFGITQPESHITYRMIKSVFSWEQKGTGQLNADVTTSVAYAEM